MARIDRSRFLEYTEPEIVTRFESLAPNERRLLVSLPTLFTYEAQVEKAARVGRLKDIHVQGNNIDIWFEFDERRPAIQSDQFAEIRNSLGFGKNEEHRTHWAIKTRNLNELLDRAGIAPLGKSESEIPEIPDVRPAAIEPIWSAGKLTLPSGAASSDLDESVASAALNALRSELNELADDCLGIQNFDQRPAEYLRRLAARIPDGVPSHEMLFRLGHAYEALENYASITDVEWPEFLAARYRKLVLQYDRTVRQFPEWRAFVRNAAERRLTSEQAAEISQIVDLVVPLLQDEDGQEVVDGIVPDALYDVSVPIVDWDESIRLDSEQLADDLLESINNILKRLAEMALMLKGNIIVPAVGWAGSTAKQSIDAYAKAAQKSIVHEAAQLGKKTGPALTRVFTRLAKVILYGGVGGGGVLFLAPNVASLASTFGWLEPVLKFLGVK